MKVRTMAFCGMFSAFIVICAWLCIPAADGYITLQTFGLFLCLGTLGGKRGCLSVLVYLLLGAVGLPVFSGFQGGFSALIGPTGGYLMGFLFCALFYWLVTGLTGNRKGTQLVTMFGSLCVCYCFGSLWYYHMYIADGGSATVGFVVAKCVLPYLLPDIAKLLIAWQLSQKLKPFVY